MSVFLIIIEEKVQKLKALKFNALGKIQLKKVLKTIANVPLMLLGLILFVAKKIGTFLPILLSSAFDISLDIKTGFVYRLFWGRGNLYKKILHTLFVVLTVSILVTGISSRINESSKVNATIESGSGIISNIDVLEQGGSIQTVLASTTPTNFRIFEYTVQPGDKLEDLAKKYSISKETIKDSNRDKIDYYQENLKPGDVLYIPEINGVLYKAKSGDTVSWILSQVKNGDQFEVLEINQISDSNKVLAQDFRVLIPGGNLPAPPPPIPGPSYYISAPYTSASVLTDVQVQALNGLNFVDPLSHPSCAGYGWSRGFSGWHDGADLTKGGGCPIRAIGAGTVTTAGWGNYGEGHHVVIDHGSGIKSYYYHSDGNIWVRAGDQVYAGQEIMNMGCTGNCTGTHLHLTIKVNGYAIDPAPYVPYWRPY